MLLLLLLLQLMTNTMESAIVVRKREASLDLHARVLQLGLHSIFRESQPAVRTCFLAKCPDATREYVAMSVRTYPV